MESMFNDPPGVYYLPADNGCPARGILLHLFYSRRSDLSKKNLISRRKKARREAIDNELTAAGNYLSILVNFHVRNDSLL